MANEVSKIYNDIAELLNIARTKAYHCPCCCSSAIV